MKRKLLPVVVLVCLMFLVAGCATDDRQKVIDNSYKALYLAGTSYDTGMTAIVKLYKNGVVGEEVKMKALDLGGYYYEAYHAAVTALQIYYESPADDGTDFSIKLVEVGEALGRFLAYINPILIKYGMEAVK